MKRLKGLYRKTVRTAEIGRQILMSEFPAVAMLPGIYLDRVGFDEVQRRPTVTPSFLD
jgi:hypothetical protein